MVQLKLLSAFTAISLPINQVSIIMLVEALWEDMPSKSSDGVLKTELLTGLLPTHGMKIGEKKDSSKFLEERTNVELKVKSLPVSQKSKPPFLNNDHLYLIEIFIILFFKHIFLSNRKKLSMIDKCKSKLWFDDDSFSDKIALKSFISEIFSNT